MELRDYLAIVRKHWWLIVLCALLGAGAGYAYATFTTPVYVAEAKVFISTTSGGTTAELQQGAAFSLQRVETYSDLVTTAAVLEPAIDALGLDTTVGAVRGKVSASSPPNTTVIDITVSDDDPEYAAALATEVARQLITVVEDWEGTDDAAAPVSLKIAQEAEVPGAPASPDRSFAIGLGLILGLCVGIALALARSALDTKVRGEKDVRALTDIPILGGIPYHSSIRSQPLAVQEDGQGVLAEGYRTLRTNLQFVEVGQARRGIVLTSSVPGEGKSTTAANLAIALADTHSKVLLVEADLRRPKLASYLGVESSVGLTDVLVGRIEVEEAVQQWGTRGLHLLAAGQIPPNPSELLGSPAMNELIAQFASTYDVVIYDTPPLLPVTDAAVLARHVGMAVLVVGLGRTAGPDVQRALESIATAGTAASGVVLSMVPTSGASGYRYQHYAYHHSPNS